MPLSQEQISSLEELEKRGKLSPGKRAALQEYKRRTTLRTAPQPAPQPSGRQPGPGLAQDPLKTIEALPEADFQMPAGGIAEPMAAAAKSVTRQAMPYLRPTVEYSAMGLGAAAGAASPVPGGAVIGGGTMYAAGKQSMDLLEDWAAEDTVPLEDIKQARLQIKEPERAFYDMRSRTVSRKPLVSTLKGAISVAGKDFARGAAYEMAGQSFGVIVQKYGAPAAKRVTATIRRNINRALKPAMSKVKTPAKMKQWRDRATEAIRTIVANKNNIQLADNPSGIPRTMEEFSEAVLQTKELLFPQYNQMAKLAGEEGISVPVGSIVSELKPFIDSKMLADLSPESSAYASKQWNWLMKKGSLTPMEVQEAIRIMNESLHAYIKKGGIQLKSKLSIDTVIANNLRVRLNTTISNLQGAGYQELKNAYGALTAIEEDVGRQAARIAGKSGVGLADLTDIFSGYQAISGILHGDPARFVAGAGASGIKGVQKYVNNPDRMIKNLFKEVNKSLYKVPSAEGKKLVGRTGAFIIGEKRKRDELEDINF